MTALAILAADESDGASDAWADLVGLVMIGLMWALSLAALAGAAWLMGRWFRRKEERMKRPADPAQSSWASLSRRQKRSVRRGKVRQDNASDLDGYV